MYILIHCLQITLDVLRKKNNREPVEEEVAQELCGGRLVMTHEGGYSPHSVPFHALAVFEELSGIDTNIIDPYGNASNSDIAKLLNHEEDVISTAEKLLSYVKEG